MFDRLKRALVESYIGAIALGYAFAQGILHFVNIFVSPIAGWVSRKEYGGLMPSTSRLPGFSLQDALPEAIRFSFLALVWLVLMRWLYLKPLKQDVSEQAPDSEAQ